MAILNINDGVKMFRENKNAVLLDVRTKEEYNMKHIDGSINIPIQSLDKIIIEVENCSTPLYVYCHSGARSARAVKALNQMGYSNVTDIGGIKDYKNQEVEMKYICEVCGWEYDEEQGYPEGGIAPRTKWENLPVDFECPICLVRKELFYKAE